jgi:hypothetical protein
MVSTPLLGLAWRKNRLKIRTKQTQSAQNRREGSTEVVNRARLFDPKASFLASTDVFCSENMAPEVARHG